MQPVSIFIAYSHSDKDLKDKLRTHLKPLLPNRAEIWDDYDIAAGQNWDESIKENLYKADIVLLLVSSDSLGSEYFYGQEVRVSLDRHARKETVVVPVILRPCMWQLTPLSAIEALPDKGKPVIDWGNLDAAFNSVANSLDKIIEQRLSRHKKLSAPPKPVEVIPEAVPETVPATTVQTISQNSNSWVRPVSIVGVALLSVFLIWKVTRAESKKPASRENETEAWNLVQSEHSIPAYQRYKKAFPNGKNSGSAQDSIDVMERRVDKYLNDAKVMQKRLPKDALEILKKARRLNPDDERIRQLQKQLDQ